ncbi:MAG: hypothetical protein K2O16_21025 [Lachnospiraceae bacterium]|nr:hypothetical protein [Lachnospiraceae bacterium]
MYLLSIVTVIVLTVVMYVFSNGVSGEYLAIFFDSYTLFFLILSVIPLMISGGLLKDFNNSFRLVIGKKKPSDFMELVRAREAVGLAIKVLVAVSAFICVVGGILVLFMTDDPAALGPNLGVMLLSLVYGLGVAVVLLPLQARLNIKIQEYTMEKE